MMTPYAPPCPDRAVDLKLDANEGRPPPASLLAELAAAGVETLRRYPSTLALERRIAACLGVPAQRIIVTAGGDEAIDRICRSFLSPLRLAIVTEPTFEMIPRYARAAGAELRHVAWSGPHFPVSDFISAMGQAPGVAFVVTPNNPTGAVASAADIRAISSAAGDRPLCVDLAYTEYADTDLTPVALSLPNVVVVRTFSKAWGLAGIRVGYAVAPEWMAPMLRHAGGPYAVAASSLAIAGAWLEQGAPYVRDSVSAVRAERTALVRMLRALGAQANDSQANFVLARFADAWGVADHLAERGVGVRRFPRPGPLADSLRITCPCDAAAFERLAAALRAVLSSELRS